MSGKTPRMSRRHFLGAAIGAAGAVHAKEGEMPKGKTRTDGTTDQQNPKGCDGPASPLFTPIPISGGIRLADLPKSNLSQVLRDRVIHAPTGNCVCWGIPFRVDKVFLAQNAPLETRWPAMKSRWLIVMHTTDVLSPKPNSHGFTRPARGQALLREHVADYVFLYSDKTEVRVPILRQHQVGTMYRGWGAPCFEAVAHRKPCTTRTLSEQPRSGVGWGPSQTRVTQPDLLPWTNWLWAWENPHPDRTVVGLRIESKAGGLILSALTAGSTTSLPIRWETRRKAILKLPAGDTFDPTLTDKGVWKALQLDLGQVISAQPRTLYPNEGWDRTYNNRPPEVSTGEVLVEYTAHPEALFHLPGGKTVPVAALGQGPAAPLTPVTGATQRVLLRAVEKGTNRSVAVKLHVHGEAGEYLAPADRHRIPNKFWYEDWSVDYVNPPAHDCTYIAGETIIDVPLGKVYVEISKGFEIAPIRRVVKVTGATTELVFEIERVLDWRRRGWVTADTHVHFLSPPSAHLEGAGEGVNVVNLLASQWGELMTNVGDFDGKTTWGSKEAGGDGEYLVRVGTENRQHVLGHISLLGYEGRIIAPMTTGGPDEAALGDPVDALLTEWARQCRKQKGLVIVPHFPNPRAEHAAAIIGGDVDGVEMTSWDNLYAGINPYSLSDWYRYLNNGHFVAAVGGTDKMAATTAVGAVRTYAKLAKDHPFDYQAWKEAVRAGNTFATYGPLMEFAVEGKPAGSRIKMKRTGGTVAVEWQVASVTIPMSRVELVVNGEVREGRRANVRQDEGHWSLKVDKSCWIALLVRGHYKDRPEIIAAHSSPVMVEVEGSPFFAAADALTILEQIEGALVYLDVLGTRAETAAYKRMRMILTQAYRDIHNRLHQAGHMHDHTPTTNHEGHHA